MAHRLRRPGRAQRDLDPKLAREEERGEDGTAGLDQEGPTVVSRVGLWEISWLGLGDTGRPSKEERGRIKRTRPWNRIMCRWRRRSDGDQMESRREGARGGARIDAA